MPTERNLTGYPSIDKPWLKYYSEEAINAPMPSSNIYEYIMEKNKNHLDDIALIYFGNKITYGKLFENIERATSAFIKLGIKEGDIVSIISITTPELVYCVYALNRIGAIANMLDPRSSDNTLVGQIEEAHSKTLIVLDQCADKLYGITAQIDFENVIMLKLVTSMGFPVKQIYSIKTAFISSEKRRNSCNYVEWDLLLNSGLDTKIYETSNKAEAPAFIWYTGGTTGEPKGVLLSNLNVNSVAEQYRLVSKEHFRQQTWLTVSAPFIAYALVCGLHIPLSQGMVCCIELYNPDAMARTIVRKKYNHAAVTPIVWEKILRNPNFKNVDLSFLIVPISGADYMSPRLEIDINNFFEINNCSWKICQGYGMTEVGSAIAVCSSNIVYKLGSVGAPLPNTIISTFDIDSGKELVTGENGEICVRGPSVMLEYFNNKDATNEIIRLHEDGKKWLHTGDVGKIDEDGNLFITGRIKRMITRYDGFKVFPAAVEEKVLMHPAIDKCSVVGQKDPRSDGGQLPVAFVVLKDKEIDVNKVIQEIKNTYMSLLPEYARPIHFYIKEDLPLTGACKINCCELEREANERGVKAKHV